jgi:1-acyl-sn-glycerol-3-phosphate acyltransferase
MGYFRLIYRLAGLAVIQLVLGSIALVATAILSPFQRTRRAVIAFLQKLWGRLCCRVMNIRIQCEGTTGNSGGALLVSNHIGSVDIFVLAACFHVSFVSKSDVRSWPVIGLLTRLAGTIFIDRARKTQVMGMVREISDRLRAGFHVAVFPEGGATPGNQVEHFKSSAFEAAVQAGSSVIPVMIRYYDDGEPSVACWPEGITFMESMVRLLKHPRLNVLVWVFPAVTGVDDRRIMADKSQALISKKFEETKASPVGGSSVAVE